MSDVLKTLRLEDLGDEQRELAEVLGIETYKHLVEYYGGTTIYIPKLDALSNICRNRQIEAEFNGSNYRQLALKYNLTEAWVRKIVDVKAKELDKKPLSGQVSLFDRLG